MPNGGGFGFGDVLDSIGAAVNELASAVLATLQAAVLFLLAVAQFIFNLLVAVISFLGRGFAAIRDFFRYVHTLGFRGFLSKLWDAFKTLRDLLHRILDPVLRTIRGIIDYETRLYRIYLAPLINLIQHLRQFLVLLRLLHFKFAARLDARLAELEAKINSIFLDVLRELNTVRQTISLFVDPFGLFNPLVFLVTAARDIGGIRNAIKAIGERPFTPSEIERRHKDRTVFSAGGLSKSDERDYFNELADRFERELKEVTK